MAGFASAIEAGLMPTPETLFPSGVLNVSKFAPVADAILGGAEGSEEEKGVGKMQHLWGRQLHQWLAARKELIECIRHGDGEAVDMLVFYMLPLMISAKKKNYKKYLMEHIILKTFDEPMRRWLWMRRRYVNDEAIGPRKNAMDACIEFLMGELKPIGRKHGISVMGEYARCAFFATALRRMMTKQLNDHREMRLAYDPKRHLAKAKLMQLFQRSGLSTIEKLTKPWPLENTTLHRTANCEGDMGGAISLEQHSAHLTRDLLTQFGVPEDVPVGIYRVYRAEAGPLGEASLRLVRVTSDQDEE